MLRCRPKHAVQRPSCTTAAPAWCAVHCSPDTQQARWTTTAADAAAVGAPCCDRMHPQGAQLTLQLVDDAVLLLQVVVCLSPGRLNLLLQALQHSDTQCPSAQRHRIDWCSSSTCITPSCTQPPLSCSMDPNSVRWTPQDKSCPGFSGPVHKGSSLIMPLQRSALPRMLVSNTTSHSSTAAPQTCSLAKPLQPSWQVISAA